MSNGGELVADTTVNEVGYQRQRGGRVGRDVTTVATTNDSPASQSALPFLMFVTRHLAQSANGRIRVTASDLAEAELLPALESTLISPVHRNFTHRVGYPEPGFLQLGAVCLGFEDQGWVRLLPYIENYPYEATSRLLYNWKHGGGRCHKLRHIFVEDEFANRGAQPVSEWGRYRGPTRTRILRDTRFLRDTVSTIDTSWAQFHEEFPFHELANLFLRQDWHNFVLSTQLYNTMHEFYFGHRQNAWKRLGRMIPKDDNTEVDMVSQLADLDTSLGRYINRVDRGETGVEREIRTQRM